jgi:hypothetical protein
MWLSENRSPCRSTPTTTGPGVEPAVDELQLGRAGLELEEAEGGAEAAGDCDRQARGVRPWLIAAATTSASLRNLKGF